MFKSKKAKGLFGSQPNTPKIQSVQLPDIKGGEDSRPSTPWLASPRPIVPQPTILRPNTPKPFLSTSRAPTPQPLITHAPTPIKISRVFTPQPIPIKPAMRKRTMSMTTSGDYSDSGRPISRTSSRLREEPMSAPVKSTPMTRERKLSMTGGGSSLPKSTKVLPSPNCRLVPMKPPHLLSVNLHWQLLPYDSPMDTNRIPSFGKARVHFDITLPLTHMHFDMAPYPKPLRNSDLDKPAADDDIDEMIIECGKLPRRLRIRRSNGITCRDVFEEVYMAYNKLLSDEERLAIPAERVKYVKAAWKARCAESPSLTEVEECMGLRRVDLLQGKSIFAGLTRESPEHNWVLHLCRRSY